MALVFAHRGASLKAPENTLKAFQLAKEMEADWVEFDVRSSLDGVLMIHHDASLADGRILAEVSSEDLPADIPSLTETLETCEGLGVNVEIKNDPNEPDFDPNHEIATAVAGTVLGYADYEHILISSFNPETLTNIKGCDPKIPTGLLFYDPLAAKQNIQRAVEAGHNALHPHLACVDASFVDEAHAAGLKVNVWTVDEPEHIQNLLEIGVDGIITNAPDVAKDIIRDFLAAV